MLAWRNKPSAKQNFLKRRRFEEGRALMDAAHIVTQRLYCDALAFWRRCSRQSCKRHRRCCGEAPACLLRGLMFVPPSRRLRAQKKVIAGGPSRIPPATHMEWFVRRTELATVVSWEFGLATPSFISAREQIKSATDQTIPNVIPNRWTHLKFYALTCDSQPARYPHCQIGRVWFCRM